MSLPNKQIGWSNESNLLWQVVKQIQHLTKATTTVSVVNTILNPIPISGTVNQGTANTITNAWPVKITDGTNTANVNTNGSITVSGISAVGVAPVNPPVGISGTDAGGLKRSFLTDTSGRLEIDTIQSLPLPTGAATELTLSAINTRDSDIVASGSVTASTPFTINLDAKGTYSFNASGTWVGSVIVEGSLDGINWVPTTFVALASGNAASTFSAPTSGQVNTVGLDYIRFRSNTISSGSVIITGLASRLVSNVMLDNSLPTGSNVIGSINNITGTVSLPTLASTSTLQTTGNTSLSSIDTKLTSQATATKQDTGNTSLASIDGKVATSAKQDTGNTTLSTIATNTGALLTDTQLRATPVPFSPRPNTTGANGTTPYKLISLASTNANSIKVSGGNLYSVLAIGLTSTVRYLKFYNKASAPTVGTDVPVFTIPVPANTQGAGVALGFTIGVNFSAGIALAITSGSADSDTGAVGAGDVILNLTYA